MKKRIYEFDYMRGFAISLVVWMHVIQHLFSPINRNILFDFVYSFHMPLFIIISGFLFYNKLGCVFNNIWGGVKRFLLPNLFWGSILIIIHGSLPKIEDVVRLPFTCWFLSSLFFCYVVYSIALYSKNHFAIKIVCLSVLINLLPGMEYNKFMIPFFGLGLIMANYKVLTKKISAKYIIIAWVMIIFTEIFLWSPSYTIYNTPSPNLKTCFIPEVWIAYFARLIVGTLITITIFFTIKKLSRFLSSQSKSTLSVLSTNSLGIYVISDVIICHLLKDVAIVVSHQLLIDLMSLILTMICIGFINKAMVIIRRYKYLKLIALGETQ